MRYFYHLIFGILFLSTLFAFGTPHADAKLKIVEQTKFYNVRAKSGKQLHSKLGRKGPWRLRRKHAIAATTRSYDVKKLEFGVRGKKCVVTKVELHMKLIYYYPRWTNQKKGSKKLQKTWTIFSRELVRHEKTHGKYFKETMRQVEKEILRTTGKLSDRCLGMDKSVKRRLEKVNAKGDARHAAFDKREKKTSSKIRKLEKAIAKLK
jgi:predicted secreted Zn-dependent protease